ncbi:MAG: sigma-70 family RNA polymerase sigma factor [Acidimicrobiia bacterium]|nr:sigma-70 family RNA polymerase sigma factor [Acidimicrobiia bacterium]NNL70670.1 sigma-70 family RNA polymerase sigma factor [Acidimicrobiia bacterium]
MEESPSTSLRFKRLYDEHFDAVQSYCLRRLPVADANDAVSEVFLVAWRKIEAVPTGEESLPWLFGVARNAVRNSGRSHRRSARLVARIGAVREAPDAGPETQVVRRSESQRVLDALEKLRPADREVLRLRAWEDLSAPQIAAVVGISPAAAEKRLARAMTRLQAAVVATASKSPLVDRPHTRKTGGDA